jgi:hypothetical protein
VPFLADDAHAVGTLLGGSGMSDVVDAHVVLTAASVFAAVLTSDPDDLRRLSDELPTPLAIRRV